MRQQILIHLGKNMKCQGKEHGIAQQLRQARLDAPKPTLHEQLTPALRVYE
jgi:hypothetical protein